MRAKPGRLYCVAAPTYTMLGDASFRSCIEVASDYLGILARPKRSAPPSLSLTTGADIIFRSTEDPDKLRGPNLSGIWMDEASLMSEDAFTILIGRLREGGEQGWLTATFTPKGKLHWTYDTFGTRQPDTALFHASTFNNPFLPPKFYDTVAGKYTSKLAEQELEGVFSETGGVLFNRRWFQILDSLPKITRRIRAWDLAATEVDVKKASKNDPDWTVGTLFGEDGRGTYYIEDVRRLRASPRQVQDFVRTTAEEDGLDVTIWMEEEGGSSGKIVTSDFLRILAGFDFHAEKSSGAKVERARPLAAQAEGGAVKLLRGLWNRDFLNEIEVFPFGKHDDQVDSASQGFNKLAFAVPGALRREDIAAALDNDLQPLFPEG